MTTDRENNFASMRKEFVEGVNSIAKIRRLREEKNFEKRGKGCLNELMLVLSLFI